MISTEQFEQQLLAAIKTVRPRLAVGLEKVGAMASTLAASYLGHYQPGWSPLKPETIERKATGDSPLLETGEMRDSITHEVLPAELAVIVGSTDKIAVYQELGTSRIPPRPFIEPAMKHALPFAEETFGKIAVQILMMEK